MATLLDRFRECQQAGWPGISRVELLDYLEQAANALDLLQRQRLQHLDVKPANLLLEDGKVRLSDDGLIKDLEGMLASVRTRATPAYAAPETFTGTLSPYTDQYSLAITYQEMLTGQRPFNAASVEQLVKQHLAGRPDLTPLPEHDRQAIGKALARDPEQRYPTCADLVKALRAK